MVDFPLPPHDPADLRAAEYVLGLLDPQARQAVEADSRVDAQLAARIETWRAHFDTLFNEADAAPSGAVWAGIERLLPANDDQTARRDVQRWQFTTALAALMAAACLGLVIIRARPPEAPTIATVPAAPLVATLGGEAQKPSFTVTYDKANGRLIEAALDLKQAGHTAELWVIPEDGVPRSLGVIDPTQPRAVAVAPKLRASLHQGVTLAVTAEQPGGSPTGQPTSTPILTGKIIAI